MAEAAGDCAPAETRAMNRIKAAWTWLVGRIHGLRVQLRLGLRMSVGAVLTYILSQALHLPLPLWAVLTAVIVTQMSVGKSLKVTLDYMEGTLGGAVYSGAIAALFPKAGPIAIAAMLALAVAPLAVLAATSSRFAAAPFTAVMVLLIPSITHVSSFDSAVYRVIEVALGCAVALSVSFLVLPERAHGLVIESATRMLELMARVLPELMSGLEEKRDAAEVTRLQSNIGQAFIQLNTTAQEAKRERVPYFTVEPDPQPLVDTLLRLRHDLIMIGRAGVEPLPPAFLERLRGPIAELSASAAEYLSGIGAALAARRPPPPLARFEAALNAYSVAFAAARHDGLTRNLSVDAAERIFALGFALEQLHQNFKDLLVCSKIRLGLRPKPPMS
jgi:uncharacterized membrane protein YccC